MALDVQFRGGGATGLGFPGWGEVPFSYDCIMYFDLAVALPSLFDLVGEATQGNNNHLSESVPKYLICFVIQEILGSCI